MMGIGAFSVENKHWRWGGMLGAGVEFAFTNSISGKLEYNYMDFGTRVVLVRHYSGCWGYLHATPLTSKSGRISIWSKSA